MDAAELIDLEYYIQNLMNITFRGMGATTTPALVRDAIEKAHVYGMGIHDAPYPEDAIESLKQFNVLFPENPKLIKLLELVEARRVLILDMYICAQDMALLCGISEQSMRNLLSKSKADTMKMGKQAYMLVTDAIELMKTTRQFSIPS